MPITLFLATREVPDPLTQDMSIKAAQGKTDLKPHQDVALQTYLGPRFYIVIRNGRPDSDL